MRHRRTTNENKMLSKMENMISMMATEKPFERLQSLEQKINEVDKIYKPQNKMFHFCKTFCSKITLVNTIQNVILNPI